MTDKFGSVEWTRGETFDLIKYIEEFEFLWTIVKTKAGSKRTRDEAWRRIAIRFCDPKKQSSTVLKNKWKSLQSEYSAEYMRLKQLQMDDDDEDLIPTNRKNVARPPIWQYYDAMDFLYTIARQQLLNERRQHEKKAEVNDDETDCVSDSASIRTVSCDSEQFNEMAELSDDATKSDTVDMKRMRPVLQRATSTIGEELALPENRVSGKRRASVDLNTTGDLVPASKKRHIDTAGMLIGQHVGSVLDSFGNCPEFQAQIIKKVQEVMAKATVEYYDIACESIGAE